MHRKQNDHGRHEQTAPKIPEPEPCSLDDDPELAHIARFSPPASEVGPDSDSRAGRDVPPPMIRPATADGPAASHGTD